MAFHMFDTDGNGYIDEREMQRLLRRVAGTRNSRGVDALAKQVMREADWDGNRRLSYREFVNSACAVDSEDGLEVV